MVASRIPFQIKPLQPTLVLFHRPGWIYEEKIDGRRMAGLAEIGHAPLAVSVAFQLHAEFADERRCERDAIDLMEPALGQDGARCLRRSPGQVQLP